MGELRGLTALEAWSKKATTGYKGVKVTNLTTSWRDGLAFCALIHHFRPDLIDFETLSKEDIFKNNKLAFSVAENKLGIAALLDAEDMVKHEEPDRFSIATYLSQFYDKFEGTKSKHALFAEDRLGVGSPLSERSESPVEEVAESQPKAAPRRRQLCAICSKSVLVMDRKSVDGKVYHKTCLEIDNSAHSTEAESPEKNAGLPLLGITSPSQVQLMDGEVTAIPPEAPQPDEGKTTSQLSDQLKKGDILVNETQKECNEKEELQMDAKSPPNTLFICEDKDVNETISDNDYVADERSPQIIVTSNFSRNSCTQLDEDRAESQSLGEMGKERAEDENEVEGHKPMAEKVDSVTEEVEQLPKEVEEKLGIKEMKEEEKEEKGGVVEMKEETQNEEEKGEEKADDGGKGKKYYPTDLNPFGEEEEGEEGESVHYPGDLNPFGDDPEQEGCPASSSSLTANMSKLLLKPQNYDDSLNPFGDEDEANGSAPLPAPRRSLNPSSPAPIRSFAAQMAAQSYSTSSLERSRNRPPLPPPPVLSPATLNNLILKHSATTLSLDSARGVSNGETGLDPGPRCSTPEQRRRLAKKRPAPKPPGSGSVPPFDRTPEGDVSTISTSSIASSSVPGTPESTRSSSRRVSLTPSLSPRSATPESDANENKNTFGYWKRKKRPAPQPAIRRFVEGSLEEIQIQLNQIGDRLLEIQTATSDLEDKFKSSPKKGQDADDQSDLIYNYLELAKETCCLARRQEELMYLKREHKLEEQHADIEFQIRTLDQKPAFKKTKEDFDREHELLERLVEVIDERNEVVENMERIDKRIDFNRMTDKLKKMKGEAVEPILVRFLEENDIKMIETKTIVVKDGDKQRKSEKKKEKKEKKSKEKEVKKKEKEKEKEKEKGGKEEKVKEKEKGKSALSAIKRIGTLKRNQDTK